MQTVNLQIQKSLDLIDKISTFLLGTLLQTYKHSTDELTLPFLQFLHSFFHGVLHHKLPHKQ